MSLPLARVSLLKKGGWRHWRRLQRPLLLLLRERRQRQSRCLMRSSLQQQQQQQRVLHPLRQRAGACCFCRRQGLR